MPFLQFDADVVFLSDVVGQSVKCIGTEQRRFLDRFASYD